MNYSRRSLVFGLKLFRINSHWDASREEIPALRRRMKRFGLLARKKKHPLVSIRSFAFQGFHYVELLPKNQPYEHSIFYSHGGGYVHEITRFHWEFLMDLSHRSKSRIIVPIYPLAPEYTKKTIYPWIRSLFHQTAAAKQDTDLILMGDSAGGGLSLALAMESREIPWIHLSATILISPWLDISMNSKAMKEISQRDPLLNSTGITQCGHHYLGGETDDLQSSPLHGDFTGLKNLSVWTGTRDCLYPQSVSLKERCREQNLPLRFHESAESLHVFPIFRTKDGLRARDEILSFIRSLTP